MSECRFCNHKIPAGVYLCPHCGAAVETTLPLAGEDLEQQVRALLSQGSKLEAVKLYKEQTGISLMEAKQAVEALERGESPAEAAAAVGNMEAELVPLLQAGRKLEAVKLYRDRTGVELVEAKRDVEALAARRGIEVGKGGGCAGVLAVVVLLVVVLGTLMR